MEVLEFLNVKMNSGYGYGSGDGYGSGSGSSVGSGVGYGDGYGSGYGSGYGDGSGYGSGVGLKSINGMIIHKIDKIETIITKLRNNIAKGYIVSKYLTLTPCYIVKQNNMFAHGESLKKAMQSLQDKLFNNMSEEERIEAFNKEFKNNIKYPAKKYFDWHNKLTGSCEFGRMSFVKNNEIDLENDEFTVEEFVELCKNQYGGEIIKKILDK